MNKNYLFVDIETTGLNPGYHEILTAYVIQSSNNFEIIKESLFEFRPKIKRDDWINAEKIHGLSFEKCSEFPDKKESLDRMYEFVGMNNHFICHAKQNGGYTFDYAFLYNESILNGHENNFYNYFGAKAFSTHSLALELAEKLSLPKTKRGNYSLSLSSLCEFFKIELQHHDAKSDCHACFELAKILKKIKYENKVLM